MVAIALGTWGLPGPQCRRPWSSRFRGVCAPFEMKSTASTVLQAGVRRTHAHRKSVVPFLTLPAPSSPFFTALPDSLHWTGKLNCAPLSHALAGTSFQEPGGCGVAGEGRSRRVALHPVRLRIKFTDVWALLNAWVRVPLGVVVEVSCRSVIPSAWQQLKVHMHITSTLGPEAPPRQGRLPPLLRLNM